MPGNLLAARRYVHPPPTIMSTRLLDAFLLFLNRAIRCPWPSCTFGLCIAHPGPALCRPLRSMSCGSVCLGADGQDPLTLSKAGQSRCHDPGHLNQGDSPHLQRGHDEWACWCRGPPCTALALACRCMNNPNAANASAAVVRLLSLARFLHIPLIPHRQTTAVLLDPPSLALLLYPAQPTAVSVPGPRYVLQVIKVPAQPSPTDFSSSRVSQHRETTKPPSSSSLLLLVFTLAKSFPLPEANDIPSLPTLFWSVGSPPWPSTAAIPPSIPRGSGHPASRSLANRP
ncbi:uncharacterized protein BJ171DRAFT_181187 [Polychytrium aggregatum]|uniref:uncharacterized protein n=1 Tax=Polychytrium aggregatum TaxID=110093 RepID=UPI0022FE1FB9|nr:uncharacterized protein BJ171DRAFT_181187 [Polychytrium aggregatum]KAI9202485.1 hypothetical protein BJ171DRAFT_181187 [Polychytrium aggregatum]